MLVSEIESCKQGAGYTSAYYWGKAYLALQQNDFKGMRACYTQACKWYKVSKESIDHFTRNGLQNAPERAIILGKKLPKSDVKQARKAVLTEINRFANEFYRA